MILNRKRKLSSNDNRKIGEGKIIFDDIKLLEGEEKLLFPFMNIFHFSPFPRYRFNFSQFSFFLFLFLTLFFYFYFSKHAFVCLCLFRQYKVKYIYQLEEFCCNASDVNNKIQKECEQQIQYLERTIVKV